MSSPLDIEHTTSCGHTWTMRHTACPDCFAEMRQRAVAAEAEVERLEGLILNWADNRGDHNESHVALLVVANRIRTLRGGGE